MGDGFADKIRAVLAEPEKLPHEFWDYTVQHRAVNPVAAGAVSAPILASTGLVGATNPSRYVGATATGHPTVGTFQTGDFVVDQTGIVWICTVAGSPGTWAAANAPVSSVDGRTGAVTGLADLTSASFQLFAAAIGYATGAGGAVTQTTSLTAGVTLNTVCGQITTFASALASGLVSSFVVTNSKVAAFDTILVSWATVVAPAIPIFVSAVGAGSFTITYINQSGALTASQANKINFAVVKAVNS